jgi:hypothetical protein
VEEKERKHIIDYIVLNDFIILSQYMNPIYKRISVDKYGNQINVI